MGTPWGRSCRARLGQPVAWVWAWVPALLWTLGAPAAAQVRADGVAQAQVREWVVSAEPERIEQALTLSEEQVRTVPDSALAHYWRARACGAKAAASGKVQSVTWWRCHGRHLREAARLQPGNSDLVLALVQFLSRAPWVVGGDRDLAREWQGKLMTTDPAGASVAAGHLHFADGNLEAALQALFTALRAQPEHPEALSALVNALGAHGRMGEAAPWMAAAVATAPRDARVRWAVVRYAVATGEASDRALEFLAALDREPKTLVAPWEIAWRRGQLLLRQGRGTDAVLALEQAQALNPSATPVAASLQEARAVGKVH